MRSSSTDVAYETSEVTSLVADVKALVADPIQRVRLFDLLMKEMTRVLSATDAERLAVDTAPLDAAVYGERITTIEAEMAGLAAMLVTAAFFADRDDHDRLLVNVVSRLGNRRKERTGTHALIGLQLLPALLALYSVGIGAVAARRIRPFARILSAVHVPDGYHSSPIAEGANVHAVMDGAAVGEAFGIPRNHTPLSDHLRDVLVPTMETAYLDSDGFDGVFDDVEYLLGLVAASSSGGYGPIGRFAWRRTRIELGARDLIVAETSDELLAAGLFGGSEQTLDEVHAVYEQHITETTRFWR